MQSFSHNLKSQRAQVKIQLAKNSLGEIGSVLRETRERKSLTVKNIRERTCIPVHHILAIESGAREKLPEEIFLISFLKKYARAVGHNEQAVCDEYLNNTKGSDIKNPNEESDAFDMLFEDHKKQKVIHLQREKRFLKVYHFYFLMGVVLFLASCYLIFQSTTSTQTVSSNQVKPFKETVVENQAEVNNKEDLEPPLVVEDENVEAKKVEDKPLIKASKPKVNIKPQTIESKVIKKIKPAPIYIMLRPPIKIEN